MAIAQGVDIEFCVGYPFNDNSNVFDFSMNSHKIDEFVEMYVAENIGNPYHVAEFNIASGQVKVRLPEDDYGTEYNNKKYLRSYNTLLKCNYMRVTYYESGRKFYCFIDNVVFDNNLLTATVFFTIDVWNTYRNYIDFKTSFIEREHVEYDTKYKHVIDEGLSPSQYYVQSKNDVNLDDYVEVLALSDSTLLNDTNGIFTPDENRNGMLSTVYQAGKNQYTPLLVRNKSVSNNAITSLVKNYVAIGKSEAIIGVFLLPVAVAETLITHETINGHYEDGSVNPANEGKIVFSDYGGMGKCYTSVDITSNATEAITTISAPTSIQGYTPKNNKCFCYPYTFAQITNHLGATVDLLFEKSQGTNNIITIGYACDYSINGCYYIYPKNYDGVSGKNVDYLINTMNYPTVPYTIDSYSAWYGANQNVIANQEMYISKDYNFAMKTAYTETALQETANAQGAIMGIAGNLATTPLAGAYGLFDYAMNQQSLYQKSALKKATLDYNYEKSLSSFRASLNDKALMPMKYCGSNIPNALLTTDCNNYTIKVLTPSKEEITAIDNYFSKYGYKVNVFDTLHYYRPCFDFKKMPDCNIVGNVPTDVINTIRGLFQQGITIWHDYEHIFEYDNNSAGSTPPQPPQPQ